MSDEIRIDQQGNPGNDERTPSRRRRVVRSGLWIGGVAVALLVGLAVSAGAAGFFGRHAKMGGFGGHGGPRGAHAEFAVDWALSKVDASDEQREQVKARIGDAMEEMHVVHEQHRSNKEAWLAALSEPVLDREALESLRVQEMALADQASQQLLDVVGDVGDILSAEQRAELIELARDFRGHRRHHRLGRGDEAELEAEVDENAD
jgi:Spy/CpxP family protein refolding chaperone